MAYDARRHAAVVFGGSIDGSVYHYSGDTWEWDGLSWLLGHSGLMPQGRGGHAMAYDSGRGVVVMFGGASGFPFPAATWEWSAGQWHGWYPPSAPAMRTEHAMAYDSARQVTVLFGGLRTSINVLLADSWEFNGTTWVQRSPATSPPARQSAAMAYDANRGVTVLYGGKNTNAILDDTWEWNGIDWTNRAPVPSPGQRYEHAAAFDAARGVLTMFGGKNAAGVLDDTWEWNGTNWTQRFPEVSPPTRFSHSMAYDPDRRATLLFGGSNGSVLGDLWEWNGTTWRLAGGVAAPCARVDHAMAHDSARGVSVLFGGAVTGNGVPPTVPYLCADTWEWDGSLWTQRTPAHSPSARSQHSVAFDSARNATVLFGGSNLYGRTGSDVFSETWEWNGADWSLRAPTVSPPARTYCGLTYDIVRGLTVLFGGYSPATGAYFQDTWEWDGVNWTQRTPMISPQPRIARAMACDVTRGVCVLFGGTGSSSYSDTWEWDGTAWTQRSATAHPAAASAGAMVHDRAREVNLLLGGAYPWEWDGTTWTQRTVGGDVAARPNFAAAYDAIRSETVLFGGDQFSNSTWIWNGSNWAQRDPNINPIARQECAMAYDSAHERTVLFGGNYGGVLGGTSLWNGTVWWQPGLTTSPPARAGHAMVFDSNRGATVLYGGYTLGGSGLDSPLSDTWEFNGTTWSFRIAPALARYWHRMAYDSSRGVTVLFGGFANATYLSDTWEYNGNAWIQRSPATAPTARASHAMAYDSARGVTVMFGGQTVTQGTQQLNDTWEWDGTNWTQRFPLTIPTTGWDAAMVYDTRQSAVLLYDGELSFDVWKWDGVNWTAHSTATEPGGGPWNAMAYDNARGVSVLFGGYLSVSETWEYGQYAQSSASAGGLYETCGTAPVVLAGAATDQTSIAWSTSGTGMFANRSSLATTYQPTTDDMAQGTISLVLTADSPCGPAISSATLALYSPGSGDGDASGTTDGEDIQGFVSAVIQGASGNASCAYDMNGDGVVDFNDVLPFVTRLQ